MARVDFLISNDRHHVAIMEPVARGLVERYRCKLVSLCEFRGLSTPAERFERLGMNVHRLSPRFRRTSAGGGQGGNESAKRMRARVRRWSWQLLLARNVERWIETKPDVVVLANDAAFPYDLIVKRLKTHGIPFVLVQEGIRFPLPSEADPTEYGQGGAAAIAAWGEASAEYFQRVGADPNRIVLTGSPKYDGILSADYRTEAAQLRTQMGLRGRTVVLLSNPIDDQGYCSTAEKIALLTRFAVDLAPLFQDRDFRLVYKLHGRENAPALQEALRPLPFKPQILVTKDAPLYALFLETQAAVILASTVGLEALLFGVPLGVLEIPRFGFVYDYVSTGGARGLTWVEPSALPMAAQVASLLEMERGGGAAELYVARQLATRRGAAERVGQVIVQVVDSNARTSAN